VDRLATSVVSAPTKPGEYHRLEGETLEARLTRLGRLDPMAAVAIVIPMLEELVALHSAGTGHGSLSPQGIFVGRSAGRDLVRLVGEARGPAPFDPRVDVRAAGAILCRCLTAELSTATIADPALQEIVARAALEPPAGYATAAELLAALLAWRGEAERLDDLLADFLDRPKDREAPTGPPPSRRTTRPQYSVGVAISSVPPPASGEIAREERVSINVRRIVPLVVVAPD
jgi:hypothetical protein